MNNASEHKRFVVDIKNLPPLFPTHRHSAMFWENLGRTIATFGFLEEVLSKAIFAFSATTRYPESEVAAAFEKWLPTLERALIDPCTTMKAQDVTDTLDLALAASGCDQARIVHKPRLLSDNGSSYVSADLADWLDTQNMGHVRGAPYHPQTQGKIERWHQTLKNRILLENYYLPGDLEASIGRFVDHYNHRRYHESLSNLTPADVYFGRGQTILLERERIKRNTIQNRRLQHQKKAA